MLISISRMAAPVIGGKPHYSLHLGIGGTVSCGSQA